MKVKVYIGENKNYTLLNMYVDESIKFTGKLADIEKLSNVFSDVTNTFSVPAEGNNELFKHYYDVDIDNTFNANIRIDGYIEIDSFPFRYGKIQLEEIKLLEGRPDTYKITFFGSIIQLTELFDDDTIDFLDYDEDDLGVKTKVRSLLSQYDYSYDFNNLIASINNPSFKDGNIMTPFIAYTDRDWNFKGSTAYDITSNTGAILDTELRPAIKVMRIIEAIEGKYGISFSRDFLQSAQFYNLFMWMNKRTTNIPDELSVANFTGSFTGSPNGGGISLSSNLFTVTRQIYTTSRFSPKTAKLTFAITPSNPLIEYTVIMVDENDSVLQTWANNKGTKSYWLGWTATVNTVESPTTTGTNKVRLKISSQKTMSYTTNVNFQYYIEPSFVTNVNLNGNVNTNNVLMSVHSNLPNMTVIEFLQGIMKMFKLVITPTSATTFYLNTLEDFYKDGEVLDLTQYIDNREVVIQRPEIYSKIEFLYEKTNNVLGKKFRETYDPFDKQVGYGDLRAKYAIKNKKELSVKLPFENMMFERLTNLTDNAQTNVVIGQSISTSDEKSFSPNNSKPILFYNSGMTGGPNDIITMKYNTETFNVKYFPIIGNTNDEILSQVTNTLNWGAEIDPWHNVTVSKSLYKNYWKEWVNSIYDLKQRKFSYSATLPSLIVDKISLNDALIINNHRYKINDYTVDLTTGETQLELFNDIFKWTSKTFLPVIDATTKILSRDNILANAGQMYYGVNIEYDIAWSVAKSSTGFGTDWITIVNSSGTRAEECVFLISTKALQAPPTVYADRTMKLVFTLGVETRTVTIRQKGLVE